MSIDGWGGSVTSTVTEQMRTIWSESLNGVTVQERDHFVELGGDSIAAAMCVARIRHVFGVDVGVGTLLLEGMTVSTLVDDVRKRIARGTESAT
jgi:acyl carrier protein